MTIRQKAKYRFIEFLRPNCYWPRPYTIEQAFGVLGWMIESGQPFKRRGQWGEHTVECLLSKKSTCTGIRTIDPIASVEDLRERFQYAFFDGWSPLSTATAWRKASGINAYASKVIAFPHYEFGKGKVSEGAFRKTLDALLSADGKLTTQLNQYHADAVDVLGVDLTYCRFDRGWNFRLRYGYDGSVWYHELAQQRKGDTFSKTLATAQAAMAKLTEAKGGEA